MGHNALRRADDFFAAAASSNCIAYARPFLGPSSKGPCWADVRPCGGLVTLVTAFDALLA